MFLLLVVCFVWLGFGVMGFEFRVGRLRFVLSGDGVVFVAVFKEVVGT